MPTDAHNLLKWCQDNGEYGQKLIEEWAEPDVDMKDVTPATKKKLLVEVLGGMHGGRTAFHVGSTGAASHQF